MQPLTLCIMQYNFEGRLDMIKFLKLIQDHDMYAVVRIGPFIQAEWNHGSVNVAKSVSLDILMYMLSSCYCFSVCLFACLLSPQWLALLA